MGIIGQKSPRVGFGYLRSLICLNAYDAWVVLNLVYPDDEPLVGSSV